MKKILVFFLLLNCAIISFAQTMEWHINANYSDIEYLGNDLFKVQDSHGKWGLVNAEGKMTVSAQYDSITPIVENRIVLIETENGSNYLGGITNENGEIIKIKREYNSKLLLTDFPFFQEGMMPFGVLNENIYLFGYLDKDGNERISPNYFWAAPFNKGKAVVQNTSHYFTLIDANGGRLINHNNDILFLSTPVNDTLLLVEKSGRGSIVNISIKKISGVELKQIETLVKTTTFSRKRENYKSISCQNGKSFYFDNAMRLVSSSDGDKFNQPLSIASNIDSYSQTLKKKQDQNGTGIIKNAQTLIYASKDIEIKKFYEEKYALVVQGDKKGVMKVNDAGKLTVQSYPEETVFYHHVESKGTLGIQVEGIKPSTKATVGIKGLKENGTEEFHNLSTGLNNIGLSYFIPSSEFDKLVEKDITINIYLDGMLYRTENYTLKAKHKKGFDVDVTLPGDYADDNGNANFNIMVKSINGVPSSSAKVLLTGGIADQKSFDGQKTVKIIKTVNIPVNNEKTYSFRVNIEEEGCPKITTKSYCKTIGNY